MCCRHRDKVRLRQSHHTTATLDRDGRMELSVCRVTPRDAGLYTCTASNEVGRASSVSRVRVIPACGVSAKAAAPDTQPAPTDLP